MIRNLEVKVDRTGLLDSLTGSRLGKSDLGHDGILLIARHLLDGPFNRVG